MNERGEAGEFRVGVGINTGSVVAGAIGGAGRLNFSVIGDAVNIAARVEAATREVDSDVLVTAATAGRLSDTIELRDCGERELKGLGEPVELFAPSLGAAAVAAGEDVTDRPEPEPDPVTSSRLRLPRVRLRR